LLPNTIADNIAAKLKAENAQCEGQVNEEYGTLYLPYKEQHYWSPRLNLTFEKEESFTIIKGLYGPRPSVWTMFVFFYFVIALALVFVIIIGFSNISLGLSGAILWLIPILLIVFLSLWIVAYLGQKMGHDQMIILQQFFEKALDK
jgi:hypothetical protein